MLAKQLDKHWLQQTARIAKKSLRTTKMQFSQFKIIFTIIYLLINAEQSRNRKIAQGLEGISQSATSIAVRSCFSVVKMSVNSENCILVVCGLVFAILIFGCYFRAIRCVQCLFCLADLLLLYLVESHSLCDVMVPCRQQGPTAHKNFCSRRHLWLLIGDIEIFSKLFVVLTNLQGIDSLVALDSERCRAFADVGRLARI